MTVGVGVGVTVAYGFGVEVGVESGVIAALTIKVTEVVCVVYVPRSVGEKRTRSLYVPRGSLTPKVGVYSYVPDTEASAFS